MKHILAQKSLLLAKVSTLRKCKRFRLNVSIDYICNETDILVTVNKCFYKQPKGLSTPKNQLMWKNRTFVSFFRCDRLTKYPN